jgi:hypothetical protein
VDSATSLSFKIPNDCYVLNGKLLNNLNPDDPHVIVIIFYSTLKDTSTWMIRFIANILIALLWKGNKKPLEPDSIQY